MTVIEKIEPYVKYRNGAGVNFTWLAKMAVSALNMHEGADLEPTKALRMGRLNHLCTLEPEKFLESVTVWPGGMTRPKSGEPKPTQSKSSADYKEFKELHEARGIDVVDQSDIDLCQRITEKILAHPFAAKLLVGTRREISIYWLHSFGVPCKSRIDAFNQEAISDLKFVRDVTPRAMNRAILDYFYHVQAAFYQDAVKAMTGEKLPYYIIAQEKTRPLDTVVYELDDEILGLGRRTYEDWLGQYATCLERGVWPGISETSIKAELPNWAYEDDLTRRISTAGMEIEPNE